MALPNNTFIVKERLESMEKKLEQVLQEEGLHEIAKDITKKALASSLTASKNELNEIVRSAQISAEASLGEEKTKIMSSLEEKLCDHVVSIEARLLRAERLAMLACAATCLIAAWKILASVI